MRMNDADLYRYREEKWRAEAALLVAGTDRDGAEILANGYARLAALMDKRQMALMRPLRQRLTSEADHRLQLVESVSQPAKDG